MRGWLESRAAALVTSPALRGGARRARALRRRLTGAPPTIHYFHAAADPYSHLTAQLLPGLATTYRVRLVPHLVPLASGAVAPDAARLADWSLRDARQLATAHGLDFPAGALQPAGKAVEAAEAALADIQDPLAFSERALKAGIALWAGKSPSAGSVAQGYSAGREAALREGAKALAAAGHYLPALFAFEGECMWGIDRMPHLEARIAPFGTTGHPLVRQLEAGESRGDVRGAELHMFLSFRSPYTYLAAARARVLAERWNARLVLRPLLPMVMRGLAVPATKRLYIVRDAKREAERLGIAFGRLRDPVGAGVERGLAVLHRAIALGRGPDFTESFLAGAFAEAADATTEGGLWRLAERAGLSRADMESALADPSWRDAAEANRQELLGLGLWGVPAFRVAGLPAQWGQDRLWAVEQDLARIAEARA